MATNPSMDQIMTGAEVFGSDNEKLGMVVDVGEDYLLMQKGFLHIKDLYLPLRTVDHIEEGRVYLNVTKSRAQRLATEKLPPAGHQWYGMNGADRTTTRSPGRTTTAATTDGDSALMDYEIAVPLREQEVVIMKQAVVTGEVAIHKETVTDIRRVTDTVRREAVHVEGVDDARLHLEGDLAAEQRRSVAAMPGGDGMRDGRYTETERAPYNALTPEAQQTGMADRERRNRMQ